MPDLEFGELLHERIKSVIPKAAAHYRKLENLVAKKIDDEDIVLALAISTDNLMVEISKVKEAAPRYVQRFGYGRSRVYEVMVGRTEFRYRGAWGWFGRT